MTDRCMVEPDHPEFVERGGRRYRVSVNIDRDGMIEYFNLVDILSDEFFFEADYQIDSLTEAQIWEIVDELNGVEESAELEAAAKNLEEELAAAEKAKRQERESYGKLFDKRYAKRYPDLGEDFREDAINVLIMFKDESQAFRDIVISEHAENFEEEG